VRWREFGHWFADGFACFFGGAVMGGAANDSLRLPTRARRPSGTGVDAARPNV
jgi:hypothetical protein